MTNIENPERTKLGISRRDYSGTAQKFRDKQNISYTLKDGREIFAKYAHHQGEGLRNNLEGMRHESEILQKLEKTGVTPKVIQFKDYSNEKKVRLVTEKISGTSLDRLEITESEKNKVFENIILSSARSLQKIHNEGVMVVDINLGTFLVDETGGDCKVVDFELAVDSATATDDQISSALKFRRLNLEELGYEIPKTLDSLRKKDMYAWAQTMIDLIGKKSGFTDIAQMEFPIDELPPEIREEISQKIKTQTDMLTPIITKEVTELSKKPFFQDELNKNYERYKHRFASYEEFVLYAINKEIDSKLKKTLNYILLKDILKFKLEKLGVKLPENIVSFLEKCLDVNPNNRPESFNDIL